ncbi:MAG: hypothetical protein RR268_06405 [Kiritimatiellia bacterium]
MNEAEQERVAELMAAEVAEEPLCGRRYFLSPLDGVYSLPLH